MTRKEHLKKNLQLAVPVMITQAGQIMVNLVDNFMVGGLGGRYDYIVDPDLGKIGLGAVSLGNAVFVTAMVLAFGFSFALSPLIAAADAKKDKKEVSSILTHGFTLNMILAVILMLLLLLFKPLMYRLGQSAEVVETALPYLTIMAWSLLPIMIFQTFRQFSEGLSLTIPVTIATLLANIVNVILNIGLIYGYWGFPRMEVEGAGFGTLIARISMIFFLVAVLYLFKKTKWYLNAVRFRKFKWKAFDNILRLGIPTALSSFFEVSAFTAAAFVCGYAFSGTVEDVRLAEINLAAHQISISLASTSFMMCVGIGVAATVRVGYQLGAKNYVNLRSAGMSAILMGAGFMALAGILIIVFRHQLPLLYIDSPEVISLASQLLIVAALFQLSDGIQLVTIGALRGMQDVVIPTLITFVAYWVIAIPMGALLAIHFEMRAFGMWIALFLGLTASAIMLFLRYQKRTKKLIYENSQISDRR